MPHKLAQSITWPPEHCHVEPVLTLTCHLLEWGLLVDIINPGKVKFELRDADLILNKRFLPVLGRSLVFMIAIGSGYETVLKDLTQFFF